MKSGVFAPEPSPLKRRAISSSGRARDQARRLLILPSVKSPPKSVVVVAIFKTSPATSGLEN